MKEELDSALCQRYPKIFRDRHGDMRQTLMCWGFEVGNGWYNILNALCSNIQWHIDWSRKERARALRYNRALKRAINGDMNGLHHYYSYRGGLSEWGKKRANDDVANPRFRTVPESVNQVVAVQIKEKFGTLRFYYGGGDNTVHGMVRMAESMSAVTCEECGSPGEIYVDGWHLTLCPQHAAEQNREKILEEEENAE